MKYLSEITYSISQIKFGPSYEYRSSVYTDISNNTINGSYHQIHSFIKYQNEKISLLFNLNNIFDTYLENEYTSFPKAGRTYKITFQLNI